MDPQVAPGAFDWIILKIAIASMKLKRTVDYRRTRVRCEPLGHGGETDLVRGIFRYLYGCLVQQGAGGLKLGDRQSTRMNSSNKCEYRKPTSAGKKKTSKK